MTMNERVEKWREIGLGRIAEPLAQLAKPALRIKTGMAKPVLEVASKFGGDPHVPADFEWPRFLGKPLTFLAQWKLSEVAPLLPELGLPETGVLSFFYEVEEQPCAGYESQTESWRVCYFTDENLIRSAPPTSWSSDLALTERALELVYTLSYPGWDENELAGLHMTEPEQEFYFQRLEAEEHRLKQISEISAYHQIGGWTENVQGSVLESCQVDTQGITYAELEQIEIEEWKLLFQIDSDDKLKVMWGDAGIIYFCIRPQDLTVQDFSKVWLILQCC